MEGETGRTLHKFPKEIRVSKRDFSKQLSLVKKHDPRPLNRGGRAHLPLIRIPLAIRPYLREPSFLEVIDSCLISKCFSEDRFF